MQDNYELMIDYQLANKAGIENPQFIEWEYESTLQGLMRLFLPPTEVIAVVEDSHVPPPPKGVIEFLERTADSQPISQDARIWIQTVRAMHDGQIQHSDDVRIWLQRVKAAQR